MNTPVTRWGILGSGNIAQQFARGLRHLQDAELVAVGSRTQESARAFAAEFGARRAHGSYEALAADPEVEVVYVATPHTLHAANTLLCLEAGKAVLCEKPFALNAHEARLMISAARTRGLFLMEAMWTRFFPLMGRLRELLRAGRISEVRLVQADFGFRSEVSPAHRLFNPDLGGGALLDVGVYPVSLASYVLGEPAAISSHAHLGETGVDEQSALIFKYPSGALALLSAAIRTATPHEALIIGTEGSVRLHAPWWQPTAMTLTPTSGEPETFGEPLPHNGYAYEAAEVARCLRAGLLESPVMPLDETLAIMRVLDSCRAQWGLRYPGDPPVNSLPSTDPARG
jgi:predicted dehydrogenase